VYRFLATLTFQGTVVGTTWTLQRGGTPGKDRNLVFVLSNGARYSGANGNDTPQPIIAIGLGEDHDVRVSYGAGWPGGPTDRSGCGRRTAAESVRARPPASCGSTRCSSRTAGHDPRMEA
jgi:hypothetical protein